MIKEIKEKLGNQQFSIIEDGPLIVFYVEKIEDWMREYTGGWSRFDFRLHWFSYKDVNNGNR